MKYSVLMKIFVQVKIYSGNMKICTRGPLHCTSSIHGKSLLQVINMEERLCTIITFFQFSIFFLEGNIQFIQSFKNGKDFCIIHFLEHGYVESHVVHIRFMLTDFLLHTKGIRTMVCAGFLCWCCLTKVSQPFLQSK